MSEARRGSPAAPPPPAVDLDHAPARRPRFADPHGSALRTATRVALVLTAVAALAHGLVRDDAFATFASFATFALLGFADFAGPLRVRFGLGLGFTALGAGLVALGTLASGHIVSSVALVAVVGFAMTFVGVFGGYPAAGSTGLILATVLASLTPDAGGEAGIRVLGWVCAGLVGSVAMVVVWPERPRPRLRLGLAAIADDLAAALRELGAGTRPDLSGTRVQLIALREEVDAALTRPGGPRAKDQALLQLLDELGRATLTLERLAAATAAGEARARLEAGDAEDLVASADVLEGTAEVLAGAEVDPPTEQLAARRARELASVQDRLASTGPDDDDAAPALLDRVDVLFPVRMLTYLALSMATNALVAVGRPPGDTSFEFQIDAPAVARRWRDVVARTGRTLRAHLRPRSRWFRNAARAAVALGAAAVVADLVQLDHAFWVVLGTLSVLRSSALDTGTSALESVLGTTAGFVVAAGLLAVGGGHEAALWVLLPVAAFAASYLPKVMGYGVGQAAFTVMVVVLFNLVEPVGWDLGLVRVQRVALGVAVAVVVAVVLWPRGLTHDLARAVAAEYRSGARFVRAAFAAVLSGPGLSDAGRSGPGPAEELEVRRGRRRRRMERGHRVVEARRSVAAAELGGLMNSHDASAADLDTWTRLVARPHALLLCGDWLASVADRQATPARSSSSAPSVEAAVAALERGAEAVLTPYGQVARDLTVEVARATGEDDPATATGTATGTATATAATAAPTGPLDDARSALRTLLAEGPERVGLSGRQTIGLLWCFEWLRALDELAVDLQPPLAAVREDLQRPWWR